MVSLRTASFTFTVILAFGIPVPFRTLSVDKILSPIVAVTVGVFGLTLISTSISLVCPLSYVTFIFLYTFPATVVEGGVAVIPFEPATNSSVVICVFSPNSDLV